jgi:hypothetical protein
VTNTVNYVQQIVDRLDQLIPGNDPKLLRLYALLVLAKGADTTLRDVHDAWALWRNETQPDHRSLIPFEQLSPDVQALDRPYMEAIHAVASDRCSACGEFGEIAVRNSSATACHDCAALAEPGCS